MKSVSEPSTRNIHTTEEVHVSTTTTQCSISDTGPNPNILSGVLVGGPDNQDNSDDRRGDYVENEVACDYNAGFQGTLAVV
ncbi:hypothetical protein CHS0354_016187 [Potamilus streckersoni]|uniref:cellulase n=1 Tax=Potamilus streckersoni TaxID=2493646 RepID=A0AAE0RXE6_9BIVA|nr:hypothetical protein CHS0354_016187 [Potamilus streckersoni]